MMDDPYCYNNELPGMWELADFIDNLDMEKAVPRSSIMRYFSHDHLIGRSKALSKEFCDLAEAMEEELPDGPEKSVCLRKLLEAKDAAVRAGLPVEDTFS